ncbi:RNA-directed DNA polymerase, partial [Tanacetum coccineum]
HRRWLEENHNYRLQKDRFDGTREEEGPPTQLTGSDILKQVSDGRFKYGKLDNSSKKRTRDGACCSTDTYLYTMEATNEGSAFEDTENDIEEDIDGENQLWKKKSVFFELPYWEYNLLRHNLDVMHIEKNVFDNVLETLLNLDGKTKDKENSHKDLMEIGIRYFEGVETPFNRPPRNDESIIGKEMYMLNSSGRKLGKLDIIELDSKSLNQAHRYVLLNHRKIQPFREFPSNKFDKEVLSLAIGPKIIAKQFNGFRIMCDWVDIRPSKGLKKDKYGFSLVKFSRPLVHTSEKLSDDPFIISSRAKQVFYIDDIRDVGWSHVIQTKLRDIYDMGSDENKDEFESLSACFNRRRGLRLETS